MGDGRPTIPAGDIARRFKLPGWLRWLLDLLKGTRIHAGPVDIQLDERPGAGAVGSAPHRPGPPVVRQ